MSYLVLSKILGDSVAICVATIKIFQSFSRLIPKRELICTFDPVEIGNRSGWHDSHEVSKHRGNLAFHLCIALAVIEI